MLIGYEKSKLDPLSATGLHLEAEPDGYPPLPAVRQRSPDLLPRKMSVAG
jgi:hypothetical protein